MLLQMEAQVVIDEVEWFCLFDGLRNVSIGFQCELLSSSNSILLYIIFNKQLDFNSKNISLSGAMFFDAACKNSYGSQDQCLKKISILV